jgi:hypothetical protein
MLWRQGDASDCLKASCVLLTHWVDQALTAGFHYSIQGFIASTSSLGLQ